ncbi:hypothetical protein [Streptomyces sp. NPDC004232]|nr:hypothetical protein [Streptomyces sp. tea 10]
MVEAALGDPSCTPETISAIREIGERCGVPVRMKSDVLHYAEQASMVAVG